jgi:hypothetical protein
MIQDTSLGARAQQAPINFSASGDNIIVPSMSGTFVKVLQLLLVSGGATTLIFKSGVSLLSGPMPMLASGSILLSYVQLPLQTLNLGDAFVINNSAAIQIGGIIWFLQSQ